jgi:hypothetical protein
MTIAPGSGTPDDPWTLATPPGTSSCELDHNRRNNRVRAR